AGEGLGHAGVRPRAEAWVATPGPRRPGDEPLDDLAGEAERDEEPWPLMPLDASRRGHTAVCRLRVSSRRVRCSAAAVARARIASRSPGISRSSASSPAGVEAWMYTSPTGFPGVPPPGPAIPVTEMPTSASSRSRPPAALAAAAPAGAPPGPAPR